MKVEQVYHPVLRIALTGCLLFAASVVGVPGSAGQDAPGSAGQQSSATAAERGVPMLGAPDGDTIGFVHAGAVARVLEADAGWVRIRVDGWVREGSGIGDPGMAASGSIGLADLRANPDLYIGEMVRWRVQFVALQRADHLRADMEPGSHFLLLRDPGGEPGFVYVVVPGAMVASVSNLSPLQRIEVTGRVLTGSSPLTGHPILELIEIED